MPSFSVISQSPQIRAIVQENILERAFHDALFPRLLFRSEAAPEEWPANVGDTMVFTGTGLITSKQQPLVPGTDPVPSTYQNEQWSAQLQQYGDSIDTQMPTSIVAIANLFLRNAQQMGLSAGSTLNLIARNRLYNAALSGQTATTGGTQAGTATIRVERLNGFTRARRPDLPAGSPVKFDFVSATNPLSVTINDNGAGGPTVYSVIGYTPDNLGDELGTGTLTLSGVVNSVLTRSYVIASDATSILRVGGGLQVDSLSGISLFTCAYVRAAIARLWQENVPEMPDGRFHCHLDPTSQSQIFGDQEFQRLITALPDYYMYKQFALGEMLNTVFFRNSMCPIPETVTGGSTATFSLQDPFAGELFNTGAAGGTTVHRPLFVGQGGLKEYWQNLDQLVTEAGVTGRIGEPKITNNGIEVNTERVRLILRAPLDRLQQMVSTSWTMTADWPFRTDALTGDAARYKRVVVVEHC